MATMATPAVRLDHEYWLAHCEGYEVRAGKRRLGIVEDVELSSIGSAVRLFVRGGVLGGRGLVVAARDVAQVVPASKRVLLRSTEQAERASAPRHEFRCESCGYGAVSVMAPARCPMCGGSTWTLARGASAPPGRGRSDDR